MFIACPSCHGSGYIRRSRDEDSDECCDYGGTFYCDQCEEELEPEKNADKDGEHLCPTCEQRREEQGNETEPN